MANNYLQFATSIDDPTVVEREWWEKTLKLVEEFSGDETGGDFYEGKSQDDVQILKAVDNDGFIDWAIDSSADKEVWFADRDGCPNLDGLANLIQIFHQRFRPLGIHIIEWAAICDKPRSGEFGGGVIAITAKEIKSMTTAQAAENAVKCFNANGLVSFGILG